MKVNGLPPNLSLGLQASVRSWALDLVLLPCTHGIVGKDPHSTSGRIPNDVTPIMVLMMKAMVLGACGRGMVGCGNCVRGRLELNLVSARYGIVIYAVFAAKAEASVCSGS
jgi:hypothetical protein